MRQDSQLIAQKHVIHLISATKSVVLLIDRVPELIYFGDRLSDFLNGQTSILLEKGASTLDPYISGLIAALSQPVPQGRLDKHIPLSLCPEHGAGLFNAPGIEGHRSGEAWAPVFQTMKFDVTVTERVSSVVFELFDERAELNLTIELRLDGASGVLQKRMNLINLGRSVYQLHKLACTLPIPNTANSLLSYHGRWCQEFLTTRQTLTHNGFIQENRRGRTSQENFPGLMVGTDGFNETRGEVLGAHFAWSGNHQMRVEVKSDGRRFIQAAELLFPGEIALVQNESYQTPWLYAAHSNQGLNAMSAAFHHYVRHHIVRFPEPKHTPAIERQIKPRPVHLNTWEGIYHDHNPDYICQMATEAAKMGVERFIIDDGWFVGRHDDKRALGDWYLDEKKYPEGLEPVIEHVLSLGMEFGLWVEPEMVSLDSNLYRAHPEWLLAIEGYEQPTGRWQYGLNLKNPACFEYLFNRLDALLTQYKISYLKWDMNRELVQAAHLGKAAVHQQTQALYQLIDKLTAAHPYVEIESCASGGGRIDFEILKRTQRFWASDCNDALERQAIQKGMSYFFPPEIMGAHIGPQICHSTYRQHTINLRGVTALMGHMGVELDPVTVMPAEKQDFVRYISLHKRFRALIHTGKTVRVDAVDPAQSIYGVTSPTESLLAVCQLTMPTYALQPTLKFPFLEKTAIYRIECVDLPPNCQHLMKVMPSWLGKAIEPEADPVVMSGEVLIQFGLSMPVLDPETAMLLYIKRCQ